MYTAFSMDICYCADKLRKDLLHYCDLHGPMLGQIIEQLVSGAVFQYQPDTRFSHHNLVQSRNMGMYELAMMMHFPG